jgi:hypothetical protein
VAQWILWFREATRDLTEPYLWSDAVVTRYLDSALWGLVSGMGGLLDNGPAMRMAVVAESLETALPPYILRVVDAWSINQNRRIEVAGPLRQPGRFPERPGKLRTMILGGNSNVVNWNPVPIEDDIVQMTGYRLPLTHVTEVEHIVEAVPEACVSGLVTLLDGMLAQAYMKADADAYNPAQAKEYEQRFMRLIDEQRRAQNRRVFEPRATRVPDMYWRS